MSNGVLYIHFHELLRTTNVNIDFEDHLSNNIVGIYRSNLAIFGNYRDVSTVYGLILHL